MQGFTEEHTRKTLLKSCWCCSCKYRFDMIAICACVWITMREKRVFLVGDFCCEVVDMYAMKHCMKQLFLIIWDKNTRQCSKCKCKHYNGLNSCTKQREIVMNCLSAPCFNWNYYSRFHAGNFSLWDSKLRNITVKSYLKSTVRSKLIHCEWNAFYFIEIPFIGFTLHEIKQCSFFFRHPI